MAVAESCLTAIMGRISAYSGKLVTWAQVSSPTGLYGKFDLWPKQPLDFQMKLPVQPVAIPGQPMPGM